MNTEGRYETGVAVQSWLLERVELNGLVAQLIKASEWNPVVLGSNPGQINFL